MSRDTRDLTDKQKAFVRFYAICLNATQAAEAAGYKASNGSLRYIGYENLTKPHIKKAIREALEKRAIDKEEVLIRLADQARSDIADFALISDPKDLIDHPMSHVVKSMEVVSHYDKDGDLSYKTLKLTLHNSQQALDILGKVFGIYDNTLNVNLFSTKAYVSVDPDDWPEPRIIDVTPED